MAGPRSRKERPPLNRATLDELALIYVGRFATTRSKLVAYLARKLRERGWSGDEDPGIEAVAQHLSRLGYVDDAAYAVSKSRALTGRGYGSRRVKQALRAAGVAEEDSLPAREQADSQAVEAALRFARRRRLGPFGQLQRDSDGRERALGAMIRAGHSFALSRAILSLQTEEEVDIESLAEKA